MQLKDVAVLITGGGSGLGAATARAMAAKGAKIAVLDQSKENAEKIAAEVKGVAVVADVTDEALVKAAIAKAEAAHGIARVLFVSHTEYAGPGGAALTDGESQEARRECEPLRPAGSGSCASERRVAS